MADLSGFTLFHVPKGWQLSTRTASEDGWEIQIVPDDDARDILEVLDGYLRRTGSIAAYQPEPERRRPDASDPLGVRRTRRRVTLD